MNIDFARGVLSVPDLLRRDPCGISGVVRRKVELNHDRAWRNRERRRTTDSIGHRPGNSSIALERRRVVTNARLNKDSLVVGLSRNLGAC